MGKVDEDCGPARAHARTPNIVSFERWLGERHRLTFDGYADLHRWSVNHIEEFWSLLWDYCDVRAAHRGEHVLYRGATMPGAHWFPGTRLNYVDQVLRHCEQPGVAIIGESEPGGPAPEVLSWHELGRQVAAVAATLRDLGVNPGDRVVGYLPNIAEAVVAFLATASVGAVWSSCGQDYSAEAAAARLGQLNPAVLVTADGYRYGGKLNDRRAAIAELQTALPSLHTTIVVPRIGADGAASAGTITWAQASAGEHPMQTVPVEFEHPLWVLFSSGTTGKPKGIVHGHGGILLEHLKQMSFHLDLDDRDTYFWYTSPSWMMWNFQVAGLLVGATILTYDGGPAYPGPEALWALAARRNVTVFGTSPAHLRASEKAQLEPASRYDLSTLRAIGATGSVLPAGSYQWVNDHVGSTVSVMSTTGGTDIASAFAGGVPTVAVRAGEISAPCLGTALEAWDPSGHSVRNQVGELVITRPLPSMPVHFWNDPGDKRYREAYFSTYPGIWRHGDWITITDRASVIVHGRSDSTLNRNGVRMGSADIYQIVEEMPEIRESLVIGAEGSDGDYWMPLFVVLADNVELDEDLDQRIRKAIRDGASPKHVPDDIIAVRGIPHTRTGKKLEIPVKRILQGAVPSEVVDASAVDDASLLDTYSSIARAHQMATGTP